MTKSLNVGDSIEVVDKPVFKVGDKVKIVKAFESEVGGNVYFAPTMQLAIGKTGEVVAVVYGDEFTCNDTCFTVDTGDFEFNWSWMPESLELVLEKSQQPTECPLREALETIASGDFGLASIIAAQAIYEDAINEH